MKERALKLVTAHLKVTIDSNFLSEIEGYIFCPFLKSILRGFELSFVRCISRLRSIWLQIIC